ncbi:MAG: hypothetical protein CMJ39_03890 [Phycisphaerae bacterium]|nr:hypothetical protein [Phycisphaerae bacterium]|tara:strand:- start:1209 stop:2060 length:852 start_codon:yes stop_codon:yes gene_type:complete
MSSSHDWEIPGALGKPLVGTAHVPDEKPRGVVVLLHGFMGYKDYGFIPRLADRLVTEHLIVQRFNFSHSGMGHGHGSIDVDRFRLDTWNRQVEDVLCVMDAIRKGTLERSELPVALFGHSRGGVTAILAAGRHAEDERMASLRGVITASAPAMASRLSDAEQDQFRQNGSIQVMSSRTGQQLQIDAGWLREQQADPEGHDLPTQAGRLRAPLSIIHGLSDPTVSPDDASLIAEAAGERAMMRLIHDADHVYNTPNPSQEGGMPSVQASEMQQIVVDCCKRWFK